MKKFLLAVSFLGLGTASGLAADLAARPYTKAPAVVSAAYNWTGFYIGVMGGYGWSDSVTIAGFTTGTDEITGGFVGGTIGYNWQGASPFVFGLEADGAWSDISYSETAAGTTFEDEIRSFGSVTGRLGYAVDTALFYVKGGYAWADNRMSVTNNVLGTLFSESNFHSGWTVGGGLEYAFAPNWSGKVEYMYASYQDETYLGALVAPGVGVGFDVHTVKGGINYRFGGPAVARY